MFKIWSVYPQKKTNVAAILRGKEVQESVQEIMFEGCSYSPGKKWWLTLCCQRTEDIYEMSFSAADDMTC